MRRKSSLLAAVKTTSLRTTERYKRVGGMTMDVFQEQALECVPTNPKFYEVAVTNHSSSCAAEV
jgi:hypothetical protein